MRQHAVVAAISLYQSGTLTLEQAAGYAGVTPETMHKRLRGKGVDVRETTAPASDPVTAK
ncbi:DUF7317 family protein [Halocatena pleomorpha]|uniref:Uncharacterized protein n=1 Tax=Halocatena pleomorpha TaxID=1785090 RepID=A0A3P3RIQ0_9EURY|nr:UPF0175 family protein [Halocatena pleomorpha]RRJ32818.1 hypothetical protein EIK79_03945 [Halocatena pleomorpha]